jgi:hypothetical protein
MRCALAKHGQQALQAGSLGPSESLPHPRGNAPAATAAAAVCRGAHGRAHGADTGGELKAEKPIHEAEERISPLDNGLL